MGSSIAAKPAILPNSRSARRPHCTAITNDMGSASAASSRCTVLLDTIILNDEVLRLHPVNRVTGCVSHQRRHGYQVALGSETWLLLRQSASEKQQHHHQL